MQDIREGNNYVENFENYASSELGETALVKIEKPFQVAEKVGFQVLKLGNRRVESKDSRDLSANQVDGTRKIMLIEGLIVLVFDC